MSRPTVSILMPAYNAAKWIDEAIVSVRAQTFPDWQLCIVDDGSTDRTWLHVGCGIALDGRFAWKWKRHRGQAAAMNAAWRMARGKYIALLDTDDLIIPYKLERQVRFLEEHPEVDLVSTGMEIIWPDGRHELALGDGMIWRDYLAAKAGSGVCSASVMSRRKVWKRVGGWDESLPTSADEDWTLRVLAAGFRWGHIPEPLYIYRRRANSVSMNDHDLGMEIYRQQVEKYRAAVTQAQEALECSSAKP